MRRAELCPTPYFVRLKTTRAQEALPLFFLSLSLFTTGVYCVWWAWPQRSWEGRHVDVGQEGIHGHVVQQRLLLLGLGERFPGLSPLRLLL
jgi:hypothetical protein